MCRSKAQTQPPSPGTKSQGSNSQHVRQVDQESDTDSDDSMYPILTVGYGQDSHNPPIKVHVEVDKCSIPMEVVDTGASISIMSETLYLKLWPRKDLNTTTIRLRNYSMEPIGVDGG